MEILDFVSFYDHNVMMKTVDNIFSYSIKLDNYFFMNIQIIIYLEYLEDE